MSAFLAGPLTGFALCWRIERRDGVALGCTNHDRDLVMDGFRYRSAPGIAPSAIEDGDPLDADALEVVGALAVGGIGEKDLLAGRWDGAAVWLHAVDWETPRDRIAMTRGTLGEVSIERGGFTARLMGPGAALDRPVSEETSAMCRAALGDRRCRVDLAGRRTVARVTGVADDALTLSVGEPEPNGWGDGVLRWLDGPNAGLAGEIRASAGSVVELAEPPHFAPAVGERVKLIQGCDKRFATCRDRFGNAANFRGEPHLPGIDLLTRYPGE